MAAAQDKHGDTTAESDEKLNLGLIVNRNNCYDYFVMCHTSYADEGHLNKDATKSIFNTVFCFDGNCFDDFEELLDRYIDECKICKEDKKIKFETKRIWKLIDIDLDVCEAQLPSLYNRNKLTTACTLDRFLMKQARAKLDGTTKSAQNKDYITSFNKPLYVDILDMRALQFIKATNEARVNMHDAGYPLNDEFPMHMFKKMANEVINKLKFKKRERAVASPTPSKAEATLGACGEQTTISGGSSVRKLCNQLRRISGSWSLPGKRGEEQEGEQNVSSGNFASGGSCEPKEESTDTDQEVDFSADPTQYISIRQVNRGKYNRRGDKAIAGLSEHYEFQYPNLIVGIESLPEMKGFVDETKWCMHTILSNQKLELESELIASKLPSGSPSIQQHFLAVLAFPPKDGPCYVMALEVITPLWFTRCLWESTVEDLTQLDYLDYVVKYLDDQLTNCVKDGVEIRLYIPVSNFAVPLLSNECYKTVDIHIIPDCFVNYFLGHVIYPINHIISNIVIRYTKPTCMFIGAYIAAFFNRTWKRGSSHTPFEQACLLVKESTPAKNILNYWLKKEWRSEGQT